MTAASLLAGLATEETAAAVLQKTTDLITAVTGSASPTAAQIAAAIKDVQPNDYALQTTLAAILEKQIVNPATDASAQSILSALGGLGTQTTAAAILAKLPSTPATDVPHSTTTAATAVAGTGLTAGQSATDAVLLNALINLIGSTAGLPHTDAVATQNALAGLATQTTLAAVLAKLPSAPALDSSVTALAALLGLGSGGYAKLEDTASASGDRGIASLMKRGLSTPAADVDTPGDYLTPMTDSEGKQVVVQGAIPENTWQSSVDTTSTTATALKAAAGTGLRNYLKTLVFSSTAATTASPHTVSILDGTTRIGLLRIPAASQPGMVITFDPPLRSSANTALNVQMSVATGTDTFNATGWIGV